MTTPAATAAAAIVPPEPPPRRRPRRALGLASLAAAQAIGVAVAVGALWATGTVSFFGDGGTCPGEPRTLATEPGPQTNAALDASGLEPVVLSAIAADPEAEGASRAPAITVAPEADGSLQTPAVAAATSEPPAVATALPPITEEEPPGPTEPAQASPSAPPALPEAPSAPPPPAPPLPPSAGTMEYTVRPGERLSDVAAFFGTTVDVIVALNGLTDPNLVVAGQRLVVPASAANTAPGQAFMSEYVVQPGETLTDIAARFGTTVEALAAENGLANPSAIRIGDRLRVP